MSGKCIIINENVYITLGKQVLKVAGGFILPSKKEKVIVREKITRYEKDIFQSDKLNEIAKENNLLKSFNILEEVLDSVETHIPQNCRDTYYKRLKNLKLRIIATEQFDKNSRVIVPASYSPEENTMYLSTKTLCYFKDKFKEKYKGEDINTIFNSYLKRVIIHELFHLASSNIKDEDNSLYSGFVNFDNEKYLVSLNEATTELLSEQVLRDRIFHQYAGYSLQMIILSELSSIVGSEVIKESYFKNDQCNLIKDKLLKIIDNKEKVNELINTFGYDNYLNDIYDGLDTITQTQSLLLDFLEKKVNLLNTYYKFEEADNLIKFFDYNMSYLKKHNLYGKDFDTNEYKLMNIKKLNEIYYNSKLKQNNSLRIRNKKRKTK